MMHITWCCLEKVSYCFSRSSVIYGGPTALKIVEDWAFPDRNSSLSSPMARKWCTKLEVALKRCPIFFKVICQISRSHGSTNCRIRPKLGLFRTVTEVRIHQWLRNDAQSLKQFRRGALLFFKVIRKIQGQTAKNIIEFDPDWAFTDCNSSLNSLMDLKWRTKLDVV